MFGIKEMTLCVDFFTIVLKASQIVAHGEKNNIRTRFFWSIDRTSEKQKWAR